MTIRLLLIDVALCAHREEKQCAVMGFSGENFRSKATTYSG